MQEFWTSAAQIGQEAWLTTVSVLTSWLAWRIYAGLSAIAITTSSLWFALRQSAELEEIAKFRGPKPKKKTTIEKQLRAIRAKKMIGIKHLTIGMISILFFGFFVPSVVLALLIYNFGWFRPGEVALMVSDGCTTAHTELSLFVISQFVASQIAMGVTEGHVSGSIANGARLIGISSMLQPSNGLMAGTLIGYRYFTGACALLLAKVSVSIFKSTFNTTDAEQELMAKLPTAT